MSEHSTHRREVQEESIDDGGPAFPHLTFEETSNGTASVTEPRRPGMSLRDHFAGLAMQGILSAGLGNWGVKMDHGIASLAYAIADAMLKARKAGGQ